MSVDQSSMGSFGDLAIALGLLSPNGQPNSAWFGDPVGGGGGPQANGLKYLMADPGQRDALARFVDSVLGPPAATQEGTSTWVPLFATTSPEPQVIISAVLESTATETRLGIGLEHTTSGGPPTIDSRVLVPLFRFAARGTTFPADGEPSWLLLGRAGGAIEVTVDATLSDATPTPGEASLGGVAATVRIPTDTGQVGFDLTLRDLQLPGASQPQTLALDASSPDQLGSAVLNLLGGLVRAQAEALTGPGHEAFEAITGLLGLRDVADLPALPLADLPTRGVHALVDWAEQVLDTPTARDAWLQQAADLVGGTLVADRDAITLDLAPFTLTVGIRVAPGTGGHPVLTPWVELALATRSGVEARAAVDVLAIDTATGGCTAFPDLRLEAVFGKDAGGTAIIGGTDPHVDSVHIGLALDENRQPAFVLNASNVKAGGPVHALVDLSTPAAAANAAEDVLRGAVQGALDALGPAGDLVARLLGIEATGAVSALSIAALISDPVAAVRGFWAALLADASATSDVLGRLEALLVGGVPTVASGAGTAASPWVVDVVGPLQLEAVLDGTALEVALAVTATVDVLTDYRNATSLRVGLARLDPTQGRLTFATGAAVSSRLARVDGQPAVLTVADLSVVAGHLAVELAWAPTTGVAARLDAADLALEVSTVGPGARGGSIPIPLPTFDGKGGLTFPAADWSAVEAALAALVAHLGSPEVDALLDLVGWHGTGTHLALGDLVGPDPAAAIETWLAALLLDCDRVRTALGPVAALLSGFSVAAPSGTGNARDPFRCAVAGVAHAPGLRVWLDPGCAVTTGRPPVDLDPLLGSVPPAPGSVVTVLRAAGSGVPDLADLMTGRDSLDQGFQAVLDRWTGTDGIVTAPATMPTGVTPVSIDGACYDELRARGLSGALVGEVLTANPAAVLHVACEADVLTGRAGGSTFDLTGTVPAEASLPATGTGTWFARLPDVAEAAAARPDRGGVGEQAARLAALLASRTDAVTLVGYGAAGAAAVRAASSASTVAGVVTVGAPWGPVAVDSLISGLGGDALRLLHRLTRESDPWPEPLLAEECTPLQRFRLLVARASAGLDAATALPSAAAETRRDGLEVTGVFGSLLADDLAFGLGQYVADGIDARTSALAAVTPGVPTALHAAVDLPVFDLDLGGLLVGAGAALELVTLAQPGNGIGIDVATVRQVIVDLHLGVHDGWLVGGPGSSVAADLRWMSARVVVPLDGSEGSCELELHEATALGVDQERWVVSIDPADLGATAATPEVKVLLSAVVARLQSASAPLGDLLTALGIARDGGLDPEGIDRLLHDTAAMVRTQLAQAPATVATALRALVASSTGTGSTVGWTGNGVTVGLDLASGAVTAGLDSDVAGLLPVAVTVEATSTGIHAGLTVGAIDPHLGGVRLVGEAGTGVAATVAAEWAAGGSAAVRRAPLLPLPDPDGLVALATVTVSALGLKALAGAALDAVGPAGRPLLQEGLTALGLLTGADADVTLRLPVAAVIDPAAWVVGIARTATADPAATAVAVLDAVAALVVPGRGTDPGWPLAAGVRVDYANQSGALRLTLTGTASADLDGHPGTATVTAGALLAAGVAPAPVVDIAVAVDGKGLALGLDPHLTLSLTHPPAAPLPLYPSGPGLGQLLSAIADSVVPAMLDALAAMSTGTGLKKDIGTLVADLGDALQLRDAGSFSASRIDDFAQHPATALLGRMPALVGSAAADLVQALDPNGTLVRGTSGTGTYTLAFGADVGSPAFTLTLDTTGGTPAFALSANYHVPGFGVIGLDMLQLSAAGIVVEARVGPAVLDLGSCTLRPLVVVRAGSAAGSDRLLSVGLAFDDDAATSVELRWGFDAQPPALVGVTRDTTGTHLDPTAGPTGLLSVAVSLVAGVVVDALGPTIVTPRLIRMLGGVLFADGAATADVDPSFAADLLDPERLLARAERLLWNAATDTQPLSLTIDGTVTLALAAEDLGGGAQALGVNVSLAPHKTFTLAEGSTTVVLEVDASWLVPDTAAGLSVYAVRGVRQAGGGGQPDTYTFTFEPGVTVAGLGVRFTDPSGPLLNLGPVTLDGIAVHVYAEASAAGLGGGVQVELAGLAFAPQAGGGTNAVANSIMSGAGSSSPSARPAFSPAIALQKHPTDTDIGVSLTAGKPPGPWWIVVQRQLGPLYLEQFGFDTASTNGTVSRVTLLFDGRVEIFGLTAAVQELSLSWLGGDLLDITQWAVDLQGLAISADMSGVVLAGGMLKTVDDGVVSYVGMLLGRFGVYGLTVFGGYADDHGDPSFFVFGAFNGPIGGPPAFFVTGIGGGLGINRGLVIPDDPSQFPTYPFIQALDPYAAVPDPMDELKALTAYFPVQKDNFWFAAGISFTCFSLVDGIAVLAVSFGDGLEIDLLGLARLALPNPAAPLVSIELGLLAKFSTKDGIFEIRAALTDNSWLLYPDVRLTGGFAFVVWWKGPLSGQFVVTLGGYHPDFHKDGYPDVPRLGLTWQVADAIVIKGGCYFALTSEAVMAGVGVQAIADFGWAWARADFSADGLVYFDPFFYDVSVQATISAGVEIDTWLGTISFSITTGCGVHVWGPDFSGEATVEVGPCSVTIPWGSERRVEGAVLDWPTFVGKYLEDSGSGTARALSAITGAGSLPAATGGDRSAPQPDGTADHPFEVFAEFELSIVTTVPADGFVVGDGGEVPVVPTRSDGAATSLGLNPMRLGQVSSTVTVTLERFDQVSQQWVDDTADLDQLAQGLATAAPTAAASRIVTGSFPLGAWGPPDPAGTPAPSLPQGNVVFAGNQVSLVARAELLARGPQIDSRLVEAGRRPLPLQATGDQRTTLLDNAATVPLPTPADAAAALLAASTALFAAATDPVSHGPQPRGTRSRLAAAAYAGDVAAPPLFGNLSDGLAASNAGNAATDTSPAPTPPTPPTPRSPRMLGYLTAGSAVLARVSGTTVSDPGIKRRPAPTTDSVHARLGLHLPLGLDVTLPPGDALGTTYSPTAMPATGAAGSARSYSFAEGLAATRVVGLNGVGGALPQGAAALRKAAVTAASDPAAAPLLRSGDVVVLHQVDHAIDVGARRPALAIDGSARVVMMRGDGLVLADDTVQGSLPVPPGTAYAAVQADGIVDVVDGLAGWHTRSRVCRWAPGRPSRPAACWRSRPASTRGRWRGRPPATWCVSPRRC